MLGMVELLLHSQTSLVKSRGRLQAENFVLRHQLNVVRWRAARRLRLSNADRLTFVWLIRWHRRGFIAAVDQDVADRPYALRRNPQRRAKRPIRISRSLLSVGKEYSSDHSGSRGTLGEPTAAHAEMTSYD
jgi:hypothetical protein